MGEKLIKTRHLLGNRQTIILLAMIMLVSLMSISCVSALSYESIGIYKSNNCIILPQTSTADSCNVTSVIYPNGSYSIDSTIEMTKRDSTFNYTYCNTIPTGKYLVDGVCNETVWTYSFEITPLGVELTQPAAILYIGFLALLILIFIVNFVGMSMLPEKNSRDGEGQLLSISYLKYFRNVLWMSGYFLFLGIVYIASNLSFAFLNEELMAKTLFMIFHIGLALAPVVVIVWVIWIFVTMFHDKQMQKLLNRGMFEEGKL